MRYNLHFITPVHVGSGLKLGKMDYIVKGDQVMIINLQSLASLPGIDPEELSNAIDMRGFDIGAYLRRKGVDPAKAASYSINCGQPPQGEIISCLKDGLNNPYLPGSSLKGALRTAILWERIKRDSSLMDEARQKVLTAIERAGPRNAGAWAAQPLERLFLGRDPVKGNHPNYDHLRALKVSDTDIIPKEQLRCFDAAVRNLKGERLETKMTLCVEAFCPGTETQVSLDIDPFLLKDDVQSKLNLKVEDLKDLEKIARDYYSDYIKSEIDFFSKYNERGPQDFYKKLLSLPEKRGGMLLRAGWGSGWHGMTVARLFPDLLDDIRDAFRLGRSNVAEFPKTRKLALMDDDPRYKMQPFGWIWARPIRG
jgi:CRISPR-associated protein Csm5